ncbi:MAG: glycosyltransferase [Caulobacteraceae bacterium]
MITPPDDLAFTVLLPVWAGDVPHHFLQAFASLDRGGTRAAEVLVCQDGPLGPDLEAVVAACCERPGVRRLVHPVRRGLHANLNDAMGEVQTPWAARADADDLNLEGRFCDQVAFLARHPEVDVLGGSDAVTRRCL